MNQQMSMIAPFGDGLVRVGVCERRNSDQRVDR